MGDESSFGGGQADDAARDYIAGRLKEGAPKQAIVQELIQRGYDLDTARAMVGGVRQRQALSARQAGLLYFVVGLIVTAVAVGLTFASYSAAAEQGGTYFICCGFILLGLYLTFRGIRQLLSGREVK